MWGIADYNVSDPNTAGMVRTNKVDVMLSVPSADVQEWTRGLEPTKGLCAHLRSFHRHDGGIHNWPRCEGYPSAVIATCA